MKKEMKLKEIENSLISFENVFGLLCIMGYYDATTDTDVNEYLLSTVVIPKIKNSAGVAVGADLWILKDKKIKVSAKELVDVFDLFRKYKKELICDLYEDVNTFDMNKYISRLQCLQPVPVTDNKNSSRLKEVQKIMELNENFHMCDVSRTSEEGIHLESWNVNVPRNDFEQIAELISSDGYDIRGFKLLEIPHPEVFCFGNIEKKQYFDVVKFWDDKWQFSYSEDGNNKLAGSIEEAIVKNEFADM